MNRLILAAAMAFAPAIAYADHSHGGHGERPHGAAQSMLAGSTPSDGAVLAEAPRTLALTFAHPVTLQRLHVAGPSGALHTSFSAADAAAATYAITLPANLGSGAYEVRWTASGQGHTMSGVINFTIQ